MEQFLRELLDVVLRIDTLAVELMLALRSPLATKLMTSVTGLGSATAATVFLGVFYLADWRTELRTATTALAIAGVVVGTLMLTVQRAFPPQPVCITESSETIAHSFPSGHAAAVTVYAMVARDSPELPFGLVTALAAVVAFSRIYLGTHYLSDTVIGVFIGIGSVFVAKRLLARFGSTTSA